MLVEECNTTQVHSSENGTIRVKTDLRFCLFSGWHQPSVRLQLRRICTLILGMIPVTNAVQPELNIFWSQLLAASGKKIGLR
jgi:hypothetical protein